MENGVLVSALLAPMKILKPASVNCATQSVRAVVLVQQIKSVWPVRTSCTLDHVSAPARLTLGVIARIFAGIVMTSVRREHQAAVGSLLGTAIYALVSMTHLPDAASRNARMARIGTDHSAFLAMLSATGAVARPTRNVISVATFSLVEFVPHCVLPPRLVIFLGDVSPVIQSAPLIALVHLLQSVFQ